MLQGLQRAAGRIALILMIVGTMPNKAMSIGMASSEQFIVYASTQRLADKAVGHAEAFAQRIAGEWLGGKLNAPPHPTTITIEIDPDRSFARTLLGTDKGHLMWLVGSEQAVTEHLLQHEVAHTVMASRFGRRMPNWANEGIASRYDNARRHSIREAKLAEFAAIDSWPHLDQLFAKPVHRQWQYAASVSLTDFLVRLGGRQRFVGFAEQALEVGYPQALQSSYGIVSLEQLAQEWHRYERAKQGSRGLAAAIAQADLATRSIR